MLTKKTIGRIETVDLPELGLFNVPVKIDTGAKTSVLHCTDYEVFEKDNHRYIKCRFHIDEDTEPTEEFIFPVHRERRIKSSFGHSEIRFIFTTKIRMFDRIYEIKLSLRDRSAMTFPMLLGRNFINGKFLVDVSQEYLAQNT